jgi:hypothetical protein
MMRGLQLLSMLAICAWAALAHAQGGVVGVAVSSGKLAVSGGTADSAGVADRMFVETGENGFGTLNTISGFGPSRLWQVPGIRISDMAVNSGLYIETIARPVLGSNPATDRVFWFWNSNTTSIEEVSDDHHFLIYKLIAGQGTFLTGQDTTAPPKLKIAAPQANDLNTDIYGGLVRFALHHDPVPPAGVYAVFARFTSDQYQPSDPFLLTFNHGELAGSQMLAGARAINAAAVGNTQDGDFNFDGKVDAADYTVWRDNSYAPELYTLWKNNFGANGAAAVGSVPSIPVPEPTTGALAVCGLAAIMLRILPIATRQSVCHR